MRRGVADLTRDVYTEPVRPFQRDFGASFTGALAAACAAWVYSGAGSASTITVGSMRCTDLFCKAFSSTARVISSRACVLWERALDEACTTLPAPPDRISVVRACASNEARLPVSLSVVV